jgi:hypothetical protein
MSKGKERANPGLVINAEVVMPPQPRGQWEVRVLTNKKTRQLEWEFTQVGPGQLGWRFLPGCPGIDGEPCEWKSLRQKNSRHGVCMECRIKMGWNGLVDARPAREHIQVLSRKGVGYKQVAEVAGISETVMSKIATGKREKIRYRNEQAILDVDESARADASIINGAETRRLIKKMVTLGYPKAEIARRLGYKSPALQFKGKVLLKNAHKVKKLYQEILSEQETMKELKHLCTHCGRSHHKHNRQMHLKALLPATSEVIREQLACFYDTTDKKVQDLSRDLRAIGAMKEGPKSGLGPWYLPGG